MTKEEEFERAIAAVLEHEGGYVNDPDDPGGETNFGIAKRYHPDVDIKNLTRQAASAIYAREYWTEPGIDKLPWPVNAKVLDVAVHTSSKRAVKILQAALCRLGYFVDVDGEIGPRTLKAANAANPHALVLGVCREQSDYYASRIEKNPAKAKYRLGWARRAAWEPEPT